MTHKKETRDMRLPLRLDRRYQTFDKRSVRLICVDAAMSQKIIGLVLRLSQESVVHFNYDGGVPGSSGLTLVRELTGFYLGVPDKPGAYWTQVEGTGKSSAWRYWMGEFWKGEYRTKTDAVMWSKRGRNSKSKRTFVWREKKEV